MSELERVIANLGYPVGMGVAPSPADLARMKSAIIENWATKIPKDYRDAVIEECARVAEQFTAPTKGAVEDVINDISRDISAAIRALKDKP